MSTFLAIFATSASQLVWPSYLPVVSSPKTHYVHQVRYSCTKPGACTPLCDHLLRNILLCSLSASNPVCPTQSCPLYRVASRPAMTGTVTTTSADDARHRRDVAELQRSRGGSDATLAVLLIAARCQMFRHATFGLTLLDESPYSPKRSQGYMIIGTKENGPGRSPVGNPPRASRPTVCPRPESICPMNMG